MNSRGNFFKLDGWNQVGVHISSKNNKTDSCDRTMTVSCINALHRPTDNVIRYSESVLISSDFATLTENNHNFA
jgi:hypothetical protein